MDTMLDVCMNIRMLILFAFDAAPGMTAPNGHDGRSRNPRSAWPANRHDLQSAVCRAWKRRSEARLCVVYYI